MDMYDLESDSFLGFIYNRWPNVEIKIYDIVVNEEDFTIVFLCYATRYYEDYDAAMDFSKHGFNPCVPGKWRMAKDERFKECGRFGKFFDMKFPISMAKQFGLNI